MWYSPRRRQNPSAILGTLSSNGRVFLLNPTAAYSAPVRASTSQAGRIDLNLSNQDFLAGRLNFEAGATSGSIVNYGNITTPSARRVYLIAPNGEKPWRDQQPQGQTILAAGKTCTGRSGRAETARRSDGRGQALKSARSSPKAARRASTRD